jgi:hypothetical protein
MAFGPYLVAMHRILIPEMAMSPALASLFACQGWPRDPLWAESNWPAEDPHVQLYMREAPGVEAAVLAAGIGITVLTAALVLVASAADAYRKKRR